MNAKTSKKPKSKPTTKTRAAKPMAAKPTAHIQPTLLDGKPLYKVLVNGRSCHGSDFAWSLPTNDAPGEWHSVDGPTRLCAHGYHLTTEPAKWHKEGCEVFECEADGIGDSSAGEAKVVVQRTRLLRRVLDLSKVAIFVAGVHEVLSGIAIAYGSATVSAYGSATVSAYGSATVRADHRVTVTCQDGSPAVTLGGQSVFVDHTKTPATIRCAVPN